MQSYKNHIINDLVWAVSSPPLLVVPDQGCHWYSGDYYEDLILSSQQQLSELDNHPQKIKQFIAEQKDKRLGNYFESLWAYWIETSERFDLIERNLQIFDQGVTIGELDFIVRDRSKNQILHWELAVKFYLGVGDTEQHENWHGPARKDRMDLKVEHLINQQTRLCQHDATMRMLQSKNIIVDSSAVILKGRLYYPSDTMPLKLPRHADREHLKSRWIRLEEFENSFPHGETFYPLMNEGWMAELNNVESTRALSSQALIEKIHQGVYRLPLLLMVVTGDLKRTSVFLVQNNWEYGISTEK